MYSLIGGKLLYNVVLVSAIQCKSIIMIPTSPLESPSPPLLLALEVFTEGLAALLGSTATSLLPRAVYFTHGSVYM